MFFILSMPAAFLLLPTMLYWLDAYSIARIGQPAHIFSPAVAWALCLWAVIFLALMIGGGVIDCRTSSFCPFAASHQGGKL